MPERDTEWAIEEGLIQGAVRVLRERGGQVCDRRVSVPRGVEGCSVEDVDVVEAVACCDQVTVRIERKPAEARDPATGLIGLAGIERNLNHVLDDLQIRRLKKRKLQLRDHIIRLESRLIPDLDA